MVAVRPTFHPPALLAKQAANIDRINGGRLSLNVVSWWWASEARMYGVPFDRHDEPPSLPPGAPLPSLRSSVSL